MAQQGPTRARGGKHVPHPRHGHAADPGSHGAHDPTNRDASEPEFIDTPWENAKLYIGRTPWQTRVCEIHEEDPSVIIDYVKCYDESTGKVETFGFFVRERLQEQDPDLMYPEPEGMEYVQYDSNKESHYLPYIRQLISKDLSEPYSIYVYRYFLYQWPSLCFLAVDKEDAVIGVIVCKLEQHRGGPMRGYIAMLAVKEEFRSRGIATRLVQMAIEAMIERDADEVALETEITNEASLKLYEGLGFLRSKRLHRYYLNGNAAYRLVLYLKEGTAAKPTFPFDPAAPPLDEPSSAGAAAFSAESSNGPGRDPLQR